MKIAIYTLGCKVNQYETQAMEQALTGRGHTLVSFEEQADAYIINTCTVTAVSDKKSRQMIRRARKQSPSAVVAVCGCYAQTKPDEIRDLDVDLISGTGDRMKFLDLLESAVREKEPVVNMDEALRRRAFEVLPAAGMAHRGIFIDHRKTLWKASLFSDRIMGHCLSAYRIGLCNLVSILSVLGHVLLRKSNHQGQVTTR